MLVYVCGVSVQTEFVCVASVCVGEKYTPAEGKKKTFWSTRGLKA